MTVQLILLTDLWNILVRKLDLFETVNVENIVVYLAGYFIKKAIKKFTCNVCHDLWNDTNAGGSEYTFCTINSIDG